MRNLATIAVCMTLGAGAAAAQPGEPPVEPPPSVETPPSAPAADSAEVIARFEHAIDALISGRFDEAARALEAVAADSVEPTRQVTAALMAREARARIRAAPSPAAASRDGRYGFLIGTSLLGLGLYGPTLPVLAGSSGKEAVGLYMIGAGTSFLVPYLLTRDVQVTWGMTDAWSYGSTRGALHGFFALAIGTHDFGSKPTLGTLTLGSLAEGIGFTLWAREAHASAGLTNIIGKGGDFGMGFALAASSLALPDRDLTARWAGGTGLIGGAIGMGAGWYYGTVRQPTWGDGEVLRAAGAVGAYAALVPAILANDGKNRQLDVALAIGGGIGGLIAGDRLLAGHHFSVGQGIITELSTLALAGGGAGLGYLISPSNDSHAQDKIIATGAILGGVAGFALAYLGLDTEVRPDPPAPPISVHLTPDLAPGRRGVQLAGTF